MSKQKVSNEEVKRLFDQGIVHNAPELRKYLAEMHGIVYSEQGAIKLIKRVEAALGVQLYRKYGRRGRPPKLTPEQTQELREAIIKYEKTTGQKPTILQIAYSVKCQFGVEFSEIGMYYHLHPERKPGKKKTPEAEAVQ